MIRASLIGIAIVCAVFSAAAPAAPQVPQEAGAPSVKSVGYYQDWQLTQPIDTAVQPGTTIYTKIVFSDPMKLKVAADNTARPVLYCQIGSKRIRYRIARHGASDVDFVSGDAKPLQRGTDDYICKYTIPEGATGEFTAMVGKLSADTRGNTMESFYTHSVRLTISDGDVAPAIVEGDGDPNLTQPAIAEGNKTLKLSKRIDTPVDSETIIDIWDTTDIIASPVDIETIIDMLDTTDIINVVDTPPDQEPRGEAFIFRKFLEQLLSDLESVFPSLDYDLETIFQTPGKGFTHPAGNHPAMACALRTSTC